MASLKYYVKALKCHIASFITLLISRKCFELQASTSHAVFLANFLRLHLQDPIVKYIRGIIPDAVLNAMHALVLSMPIQ